MAAADDWSARIARAVAGDQLVLTRLLTDLHPRLLERVSRRIPHDLRATIAGTDLLQDTYLEVFQHVAGFDDRGGDSFYRWVATIALRKLHDAVKRRRSKKRGGGAVELNLDGPATESSLLALYERVAADVPTASRVAARAEGVAILRQAIESLPDDWRHAVCLVYLEGLSVAAAAEVLGRSEKAVEMLCRRGKRRLREILGSRSDYLSSG